jgi:hypothetical protein
MIANPDSHVRWRAYRCIGVVTVTALALLGGLIVSLPRADVAGSLGVAVADPGDPTVAPTSPDTPPPTVAPTAPSPSVDQTTPQTAAPTSSPATVWDQADSSNQSSGQWQPPSQAAASRNFQATDDGGVADTTTPPMTTTEDLLVGPATTRAPATTVAPRDVTGSSVTRSGGSSDPKIWAIVAALAAVAVGLGVATVSYWRRTRPTVDGRDDERGDDDRRATSRRRSRYADLVVTSPEPQ